MTAMLSTLQAVANPSGTRVDQSKTSFAA